MISDCILEATLQQIQAAAARAGKRVLIVAPSLTKNLERGPAAVSRDLVGWWMDYACYAAGEKRKEKWQNADPDRVLQVLREQYDTVIVCYNIPFCHFYFFEVDLSGVGTVRLWDPLFEDLGEEHQKNAGVVKAISHLLFPQAPGQVQYEGFKTIQEKTRLGLPIQLGGLACGAIMCASIANLVMEGGGPLPSSSRDDAVFRNWVFACYRSREYYPFPKRRFMPALPESKSGVAGPVVLEVE